MVATMERTLNPWYSRKDRDRATAEGRELPEAPTVGFCTNCTRWRVTNQSPNCYVCGRGMRQYPGVPEFPNELAYRLMELVLLLQPFADEEPEIHEAMNPRYLSDNGTGVHRRKIEILRGIAARKGFTTVDGPRLTGTEVVFQDADGEWWRGYKTGKNMEILGAAAPPHTVLVDVVATDVVATVTCSKCGKGFENTRKLSGHRMSCRP